MLLSPQNIADVLQRSPERLDRSGKAATLQSLPGSYRSYWADAHRLCMYLVAFAAAVLFFICDLVQKKHGEQKVLPPGRSQCSGFCVLCPCGAHRSWHMKHGTGGGVPEAMMCLCA